MAKQIAVLAVLLLLAAAAVAQNSKITGFVLDPAGAAIGNAYVLIYTDALDREHRTPYRLELRTTKQGEFTATLPPGFLDVFIAAPGFTPYCQKLRMLPKQHQEIQTVLKIDPLVLKEYGHDIFVEPPQIEPQRSPVVPQGWNSSYRVEDDHPTPSSLTIAKNYRDGSARSAV